MSESVADSLGISPSLSFRGTTYRLAERNLEMEGAVEADLRRRAREAIQADREFMTPAEYVEHLRGWRQECASAYAWDMPACQQFAQSPRGLKLLALLQMKEGNPEEKVTPRLVEDWCKDPTHGPELLEAVLESNFPFLGKALREMRAAANGSTGISSSPDSPVITGSPTPVPPENSPAGGSPASSTGRATSTVP